MADDIRIDSHKLIYHPQRVADYLRGENIYPLEIEIGLSGACNHRCIFCAVDYMEYNPAMLDAEVLLKNLAIMHERGLKSIIFAGEGEPLLNKNASKIITGAKNLGIDCALATNGVLLTENFSNETLKSLTWIRFSISAATEKTYQQIHQSKDGDLAKVFSNLRASVEIKRAKNLTTTLGTQLLLLPENKNEVVELASKLKEIGVDYFTIKPFSQHPASKTKIQVNYDEMLDLENAVKKYEDDNYKIYFRRIAMENLKYRKPYHKCRGLSFMTYLDARGDVYPCIVFMGNEKLKYGNLYEYNFAEIWESEKAKKMRDNFCGDVLHNQCREACRLDEINKYLEALAEPNAHINFI